MSQGILVFQAIITIACIAFVLAAGVQESNRLSKLMLIVAFLCLIENAAYFMELQAKSVDAILLIMKLRYIWCGICGYLFPPFLRTLYA